MPRALGSARIHSTQQGEEARSGLDEAAQHAVPEGGRLPPRFRKNREGHEQALRDVLERDRERDCMPGRREALRVAEACG